MMAYRSNYKPPAAKKGATLIEIASPPLQPIPEDNVVVLAPDVVRSPDYQRRLRLLGSEYITKKDAYWLAGVARATWDRARVQKLKENPKYKDFPTDYHPSGNPNGHPKFKPPEILKWVQQTKK